MKPYSRIIKLAIALSLVAASVGNWIFLGSWAFLPVPLVSGFLLAIVQKENGAYKFIGKLLVGSLVFGFLSVLLIDLIMFTFSNLFYNGGLPFMPLYNPLEYLIFVLAFFFVCFMGGLVGIVAKGFYEIIKIINK